MNYTYLLRCADGSLYCGWTNRLRERVAAHNAGKGAKYTKGRRPVELVYYEVYDTKEEAMRRETAIKALKKEQKELLAMDRGFSIIISPAKKMRIRSDEMPWRELPVFVGEAKKLKETLRQFSEPELAKLFAAGDSITHENYLRYRDMDLMGNLTPAVLAYVGIQYQYMAPQIFSSQQWEYVCRNLRILSGFYGILRADDGVVPYRLEMQARLPIGGRRNLYEFWGDRLCAELKKERRPILNLASKEYSKAIEPYIGPEDRFVTCVFGTETDRGVKVKATEAKMARGEMVRFLAERGAKELGIVKEFDRLGYGFCPERSCETEYVFLKRPQEAAGADRLAEAAKGRHRRKESVKSVWDNAAEAAPVNAAQSARGVIHGSGEPEEIRMG